ncbi:SDR family NAD(P)-dependent oxidoreductase [Catenulispora sp. NL8]|uniref:SDR family NAD(P)-dependent oxidoreductase n=1 Tax=Catenulispora pinistramenti TaxID=2705254 RepID=A0ABS5KHC6_9ACTN|nr:type I polyketide synthase [Catenulispora pinistramenti]MBS2545270.1 SDR family NAD(P)-dependent oxidoreductase [Catenulispora pinistramenti]
MASEAELRDYLKWATTSLHEARERVRELEEGAHEPIAVVAMGCRLPGGVRDPEGLWDLVDSGTDAMGAFPADRGWDVEALFNADRENAGTSYVREGGFVYDAGQFDAGFFGINPREALAMDPQQRLLLETSWEALERAGLDPRSLRGSRTGVFVGASLSGYGVGLAGRAGEAGEVAGYLLTGISGSVISGRLSYVLGLEGPAVTVDTACSSALVALHLACQALRSGECDMALAGGVMVMADPAVFTEFSKQQGLAADGRCKSFATAADGTGWAEGAGIILVERLSDARRNGHEVLAVVRGSAVNQDGASNGLTAPNGPSQRRVIRAALTGAGLTAADVDAVEGHGTGTTLGDPIEARALLETYGRARAADRPLWLGSLKSNIGHAQAAAGAAGVIKMVMALRHQKLPRTLHVDEPSSLVDWSAGNVRLLTEPVAWPAGERVRRAGVSAFGVGGTNAHVILEEAPEDVSVAGSQDTASADGEQAGADARPAVPVVSGTASLVVSARSDAALRAQAAKLRGFLAARPETDLRDVAWSLAATRSAFEHRAVVRTTEELAALAEGRLSAEAPTGVSRPGTRVGFVFAGQGSQRAGMAAGLYAASPVFAVAFDEACGLIEGHLGLPVREVALGTAADAEELANQTVYAQSALFALQVGVVAMLGAVGVAPAAVAGHSVGEVAAAYAAGALSLADACELVAARGRVMQELPTGGAMTSIAAPEAEVVAALDGVEGVFIAAVNGPSATVISGEKDAVDTVAAVFAERGIRVRSLRVSHAFHSHRMDPALPELSQAADVLAWNVTTIPWVSTATGAVIESCDGAYWAGQARGAVRFADAVTTMAGLDVQQFIEIGPDSTLCAFGTQTLPDAGFTSLLRPGHEASDTVLNGLARAWTSGVSVDWTAVLGSGQRLDLPTYAFQHQHYWLQTSASAESDGARAGSPAEDRFWAAVEDGDLDTLTETLAVGEQWPFGDVVPELAAWRRRESGRTVTDGWRYRLGWSPVADPEATGLAGNWLLVAPAGDGEAAATVSSVATALSAHGVQVIEVAGDTRREALAERLGRAWDEAGQVAGVLSLLALDSSPLAANPEVTTGLAGTLSLVQALGDAGVEAPLWLLTQGAVAAGSADVLSAPIQAQAWGLGRVAALEHPDRWGGLIDLPPVLDDRAAARLCGVLAGCGEDQVALRATGVLARRLSRATGSADTSWTPRGTVLITGGTGAVAGHVARWAVDEGASKLVLTSRSAAAAAGAAGLVAGLADRGAEVELIAADVADRDQLSELVTRTGELSAVLHTAGVVDDGLLDGMDSAKLARVLAAKAVGAANLDELTADQDLDAFVLFSSSVATFGGPGQGNYAAANAYLDALAQARRDRGLPATSVAWGPWAGDGMAQASEAARQRVRRSGLPAMAPESALEALGRVAVGPQALVAVMDVDWDRFGDSAQALAFPLLRELPDIARAARVVTSVPEPEGELARQLAGLSPAEQVRELTDVVRSASAGVLGHATADTVEAGRAFKDLGFDSLTSLELRNRLSATCGLKLSATLVFDYPTPILLAQHLRAELVGQLPSDPAHPASRGPAAADELIAIVGMGCRFPGGVRDPRGLWDLLAAGGDAISGFPTDRGWDMDDIYDPDPDRPGTSYVRAGGFIHDVTEFDPEFFGISPREALAMDPQQRLLLEVSWEALEQAGIEPKTLQGSATGIYAGAAFSGYGMSLAGGSTEGYLLTGISTSVLSGRVAYTLGLEGPAVTIDTACSSSLVALHLACQALRTGECDLALAGGVSVTVTPAVFVGFSRQRGVSEDGRCKSFGAGADGSGWAEGAGMIVVERLSDAVRNGHRVLAVVRGSATNQDGASNGLTAPNGPSQQRVIRAALRNAGLGTGDVDVVEAHGSGTSLGDPIEAGAVLATYGQDRPEDRPLWLGSVKSNIGHAQAAAGAAGLIKMVMALRNGVLPKTLHAEEPSPLVDWSAGDVRLLTTAMPWDGDGRPRRAGVSGFGISGTNAHVILEEAPAAVDAAADGDGPADGDGDGSADAAAVIAAAPVPVVLAAGALPWVVSGRSDVALRAQAGRLREFVLAQPGLDPVDVAHSLAVTRSVFEHRAVVIGSYAESLAAVATGQAADAVVSGVMPATGTGRTVFVFPGQGAQFAGMGRELLGSSPIFAARMAECAAALAPLVSWSLLDVVAEVEGAPSLAAAEVFQPVLWAVLVSLAAVWQAAGVTPDAVVGHSQGEIAAATVAGALSLEDAARVVVIRSRALSSLNAEGAMVSVVMPEDRVRELIAGREGLAVAAVNSPAATVVSGDPESVAAFEAELAKQRVLRWRLPVVDYVAHSAGADALESVLAEGLAGIEPQAVRVPMLSTVTGQWLAGTELDGGYWFANVRDTVRFADAVKTLAAGGYGSFIEVSPQPVLTMAITETTEADGRDLNLVTGTVERENPGAERLIRAFATAFVAGIGIDWPAVIGAGEAVELPTYAFQRQRYWPDSNPAMPAQATADPADDRFWAAVENEDFEVLADALEMADHGQLSTVLPALAAWRRRERDRSAGDGWRYRVTWSPFSASESATLAGTWLLVAPADVRPDLVAATEAALAGRGAQVSSVAVDVVGVLGGADAGRAALGALIEAASGGRSEPIAGVVSLLALDERPIPGLEDVPAGLAGTLGLLQALGDAGVPAPLWVLTSGAVATNVGEPLTGPVQAQVWGLGLAAGPEYPDRWGGLIDLPPVLDDRAAARLCGVLAATDTGSGVEDQVAIRDGVVLGRRLVRAVGSRERDPWTPRGTVLVTGGSGAIAGHLAGWLAEREAPRIVLASRGGPAAFGTAAQAAALAGAGSRVDVVVCDVSRRADAAGLLAHIGADGPALSTVLHTAGVLDDGLLDGLDPGRLASVLAAKATGAAHLDELTAETDLDAFVLFSSAAATLGGPGQGNYGAANAYLDALARRRAASGLPALSVAWGPWAVGMAQSNEAVRQRMSRGPLPPMDPRPALAALGRALAAGDDQVAVMDVDWAQVVADPAAARHPFFRDLPDVREIVASPATAAEPEPPAGDLARRLAVLSRADQERQLVGLVLAEVMAVLGHDPAATAIDPGRPFSALGFDSLTSLEMRQRLSAATELRLTATLLFDYPTPLALAGHLREELLGGLAEDSSGASVTVVQAPVDEPIAIVGMGCRFPGGADGPERLWELLAEGRDAIAEFPTDRGWDLESLYDPDPDHAGTSYTRYGGFVNDAGGFDPAFFGISPREALAMDPQQRLLLEVCWEAFEHAGLDPEAMRGTRTGVFAGATTSGYGGPLVGGSSEGYLLTGTATSVLSGRVSYTLGLEGPAVTIDTACSSSLVALHQAAQALRSGECTMALAAGVSLMVTPAVFVGFSRQRGMSEDGRCKSFGAEADGSGWAEGAGVIVLERLSEARRNGHRVLAVVAGSALNQDGASNGLTAPNGPSQQRVIRAALQNAGVDPDDVDVVEAHGSGTSLGDPIEAQALLATYGQTRTPDRPLWLGSIKSNFGHPQAAAGVAGIIKMVLALQNGVLPKTLHAEEQSPHVDWTPGTVRVLTEARAWPVGERARLAGVSAFGMSGTNAHIIIGDAPDAAEAAEAPASPAADPADQAAAEIEAGAMALTVTPAVPVAVADALVPWVVSGRTEAALRGQAGRLREFSLARPELDPRDAGHSLAATRSVFEHRAVVLGSYAESLAALATGQAADAVVSGVVSDAGAGRSVFVFPGQGAQFAGMGRELLNTSPIFAARMAECGAALAPLVSWSLVDVVAGVEGAPSLDAAEVFQPVLWAVLVSLAAVWEAAGVIPDAVVGHSQGEIAAATVAGALSLEDAARVVVIRSRALSSLNAAGAMVSVVMPEARVRELIAGREGLAVAAVNSPAATVVSGDPASVDAFEAELAKQRVLRWRLPVVDYVAHSAGADALESVLAEGLAGIEPQAARIPMLSTVTGQWLEGTELDGGYWFANVRDTVRFADAIRALAADGYGSFLEISPQPVLTMAVTETAEEAGHDLNLVTGTVDRENPGAERLIRAFATAFVAGIGIDWPAVIGAGETVELPTYAFQRQRYWPDEVAAAAPADTANATDDQFWAAVEAMDLETLADTLAIEDSERLGAVVPALAAWRRRENDRSATAGWRYRADWVAVPEPQASVLSGTWLLIAAANGDRTLVEATAATLTDRGARVVALDVDTDGVDRTALAERISALRDAADEPLSGILSLLALDEGDLPGRPGVGFGIAASQTLVQALGDSAVEAPLWFLTSGAVAVSSGEALTRPTQAQVWGLGRVVALEHPERWGGVIDLPAALDDRTAARLCAVLAAAEPGSGFEDGFEDQVAIRAGGTYARRLIRAARLRGGRTWQPRGSVLITGGTGAAAQHVAAWLAERGAPRIVLAGRTGPAAGALAGPVARLAAAGSSVTVVACDTADRDRVSGLLDRIDADGPELRAVVHTAGVGQGTATADTTVEELAAVLGGKAAGARHLDELTADRELDAFILFSSIAATWGSGLQPGYSAANTYLDALAENRRSRGLAATSVAWGPWGGGGMTDADAGQQLERRGLRTMDPQLLVRALAEAVDGNEGPITVADVDWDRFAPPYTLRRPSPLLADLPEARRALAGDSEQAGGASDAASALTGRLADMPAAERERHLVNLVRTEAAAVLGHDSADAVEAGRAFSELGFDSLTSVELRNRVSAATGLRLPATLLFDYPTPGAVADFVRDQLGGAAATEDAAGTVVVASAAVQDDPIVIVAMGCRFPGGVSSPEDLWELVASGTDAVGEIPADRGWDLDSLFDPDPDQPGTMNVRQGSFVADAAGFDPAFFGISPREALAMDPQQRLLLEVAWESLERAGIDPDSLRGSATGVFVGASPSGYGYGLQGGPAEGYLMTGTATSVVSGRVSYALGLEGPAVTVDTACSSSLVALHQAAQALRAGECELALVGGAWVTATPGVFLGFGRQHGLALDGRSKAFGESADGMGVGEGAGMIVVERLSDARRNGHQVLAVVRGSAVNQDGASNGLTAPNGPSQQRVIRAALANAGLTAADIDAVEAHGTGTRLGDPIEAQALLATYGQHRPEDGRPLWLGSLKSNIGHAQAAAGVAGVIKMVMALRRQELPRTLHSAEPSSHVDWTAGNVRLLAEPVAWPTGSERVRRAGVSSFGMSGTNVHTILEEAPVFGPEAEADAETAAPDDAQEATQSVRPPVLSGAVTPWVVSGRGADALRAQAERLRAFLTARPDLDPGDVAWSLATTRSALEDRAVAFDLDGLAAVTEGRTTPGVPVGTARPGTRVGFVFAGQGSQRAGMAAGLYAASPVFAAAFDEACGLVEGHLGLPVRGVALGTAADAEELANQTVYAQAALFALQVGVVAMLAAVGVAPSAVAGHSVGEVAAAYAAGVLSLADASALVAARGRLMQALPTGGAMTSIAAPESEVLTALDGVEGVWIAAVNGPSATVVSGEKDAVDAVSAVFAGRGVRVRSLRVSHAFHSHRMDPMLAELSQVADSVDFARADVPWVSTAAGAVVESCDGSYWADQARSAVRYADAVTTMAGLDIDLFVEIGPDGTLSVLGTATAPDAEFVPLLRPGHDAATTALTGLARAWVHGAPVDWAAVLGSGNRVELPTYAFQRQRYWPSVTLSRSLLLGTGTPGADDSGQSAIDARFWAAVEDGDLGALAEGFAADGERPFGEVLGELATWRRRERDNALTDGWRYRASWPLIAEPASPALAGDWLVVAPAPGPDGAGSDDAGSDLAAVVGALTEHGAQVTTVEAAAGQTSREDLARLIGDRLPSGGPAGVVSLLAFAESPVPGAPEVPRGLAATLGLIQALGDLRATAPLWVLTRGAIGAAAGETASRPLQAQAWGLGRVAALEHPDRWGGLVDLPPVLDAPAAARLCGVLAGCGENEVAVRADGNHARRLEHAPAGGGTPWTPHGTVLVTGGTGAIAGQVADWLAGGGADRLVLTSRSGPDAAGVGRLAADLAAGGAEVDVVAADIVDRDQTAGLLARIGAAGAALSAVMHTAGVLDDGVLDGLDTGRLRTVLAAKAVGAANLDELTADQDLDAFVLFSSAAATFGGPGQGNYAAANAYLDALAEARRGRGLPGLSVAWGPWAGAGLAAASDAVRQRVRRGGLPAMEPEPAVRALSRVAAGPDATVAVMDVDWAHFASSSAPFLRGVPEIRQLAPETEDGAAPAGERLSGEMERRLAGVPAAMRLTVLTDLVRTAAAAVLGYASADAVGADRAFSDLGFDSLTSLELRNNLAVASGLPLSATLVFDYPTPAILAEHLRSEAFAADEPDHQPILTSLDELAETLAAAGLDGAGRGDVLARLEALARDLRGAQSAEPVPDRELQTATDAEMFELLERELQDPDFD